ncbi:hypothetical protein Y032_0044g1018 [Ancylostoma ceylanicum]|uniref:Uncharacterized protein n=1 Tax=Ancylostoma ceylanicum TaxID=53326 RepID=A0A016UCZ1_9BILA|nr:hypothetical protein Y032_0044g1018 [Ancylostoma ceylanicum]
MRRESVKGREGVDLLKPYGYLKAAPAEILDSELRNGGLLPQATNTPAQAQLFKRSATSDGCVVVSASAPKGNRDEGEYMGNNLFH